MQVKRITPVSESMNPKSSTGVLTCSINKNFWKKDGKRQKERKWKNKRKQEGLSVECQPPAFQKQVLHSEQVWTGHLQWGPIWMNFEHVEGWGPSMDWGSVQGHPVNRMTDTTENIDFPQLRLPAVTTQVRCVVLYLDSLGSPHDRGEHRRVTAALGRVRVERHETEGRAPRSLRSPARTRNMTSQGTLCAGSLRYKRTFIWKNCFHWWEATNH